MKRRYWCLLLAACLVLAGAMTSFAAETKIEKVEITVSADPTPANGAEIGDVKVTASGSQYTVSGAEYVTDADVWELGDKPVVSIELRARSGYRFSYTSKSHFSISGEDATFKRARIYDDGEYMELQVTLGQIKGTLDAVEDLEWDGSWAMWSEMAGAKSYEVRLYRNERLVTTVTTTSETYNFAGYFTRTGDYTFRVRAIAQYNSRAGEWSGDSESNYVSSDDLREYGGSSGSGGQWKKDGNGWWYQYSGGGYPTNGWNKINGVWYYFNGSGYMITGWKKVDGSWYYLNDSGAMTTGWQQVGGTWYYMDSSGVMQTGWQWINGRWYYLNNSGAMLTGWQRLDGSWYYLEGSGAAATGWQQINGVWYCFDSSGVMYEGTWTPDGYYVDSSGAYTGTRR